MKRFSGSCCAALLIVGSIGGCSSDESAGSGPPAEAGPGGGSSTGGRGGGGVTSTGGAATGGSGGSVATGGTVGSGGARVTDAGTDARGPEQTGQMCKTVADCYPNVLDAGALAGAVQCLTKVPDGYCTHKCNTDADCCAVPGECRTDLRQVCSPFENTGYKVCFLSCEPGDIRLPGDAGTALADGAPAFTGGDDFCRQEAGNGLGCRSTGGGSQNRKVCLPTGGAPGDGGGPPRGDASPGDASSDSSATPDAMPDGASAGDAAEGG